MTDKVLIVDDEPGLRQMLGFALTGAGFTCSEVADAEQAELAITKDPPNLVLLDWMLPGVSGVDLARRLKRDPRTRVLPIIMLTTRGEEGDKVRALEVGADDYVTKPFSTRELVARIKAVLRRSAQAFTEGEAIEVDGLRIDTKTHHALARDVTPCRRCRAATQEPLPRRDHPCRDVTPGAHAAPGRARSASKACI